MATELMSIDQAFEKYGLKLNEEICKGCDLKPICEKFDSSCRGIGILERLFLHGRISWSEATKPLDLPKENETLMVMLKLDASMGEGAVFSEK